MEIVNPRLNSNLFWSEKTLVLRDKFERVPRDGSISGVAYSMQIPEQDRVNVVDKIGRAKLCELQPQRGCNSQSFALPILFHPFTRSRSGFARSKSTPEIIPSFGTISKFLSEIVFFLNKTGWNFRGDLLFPRKVICR